MVKKELKDNLKKEEPVITREEKPVVEKVKRKPSQWILDIKEYQAKNNLTYKQAMMKLSQERRIAKKE